MPNVCFVVEYDGSAFSGWQSQGGAARCIQDELRRALETSLRAVVKRLTASGRTDAGVHARRQVVSFYIEKPCDLQALGYSVSCIMRGELAVLSAFEVPESFHPQLDAIRKRYSYHILYRNTPPTLGRGKVWHLRGPLQIEQLCAEARFILGSHDFSSFRNQGCVAKNAERTIFESHFEVVGESIVYFITGSGFLKQMVRNIVGTLIDRARGRIEMSMLDILAAKDRRRAGVTAPAAGLFLEWVEYPQGRL